MSWWVCLVDTAQLPECSYGTSQEEFEPDFPGDVPCPEPCYPCVEVEGFDYRGGTYAVGGTGGRAELNVTYNYGGLFREALRLKERNWLHFDMSFKDWLNGRKAADALPALEEAVGILGDNPDGDYWETTPGNAGHALKTLLGWAKQHPEATFKVS